MSQPSLRAPTPHQHAALGAALFQGDDAIRAWADLQQFSDYLDVTDQSTFRLLPMTYRNLRDAGLPETDLVTLKGIYRQAWYRNRVVIGYAHRTVKVLREAGIEPLALKGLGLLGTAYEGVALRPMDDIDLLVRPGDHRKASEALLGAGWLPTRGPADRYFRRAKVFHGMPLLGTEGIEVDIHRAMLEENISPRVDDRLWERAVETTIDGLAIKSLSPEDHLLNACVHGSRWDWGLPLRWVVDVAMIVRSTPALDWDYVLTEAKRRGVALSVAAGLGFVAAYCPEIPREVLQRARANNGTRFERWNFGAQQARDSVRGNTSRTVGRYLQMSGRRRLVTRVRDFPVYLEWIWGLEDARQLPREAFDRVRKRAFPPKSP